MHSIGTKSLIITLEYFPLINSAPFTVTPHEVDDYYGDNHIIKHVESPNLLNHGMVKKWNLAYLIEHGFVTTKYSDKTLQAVEKLEKQHS
jgi:thiopurine S-methyltransferase